jgi:hypothetical protein
MTSAFCFLSYLCNVMQHGDPLRDQLSIVLTEYGAGGVSHSKRSLLDHLLGTFDLLRKWNCDSAICAGGGLHSIYGTAYFKNVLVSQIHRDAIRDAFGQVPERLAWLFGTLERRRAFEDEEFIDNQTGASVEVTQQELQALRLIEAANLIDQGHALEKYPRVKAAMEFQTS